MYIYWIFMKGTQEKDNNSNWQWDQYIRISNYFQSQLNFCIEILQ